MERGSYPTPSRQQAWFSSCPEASVLLETLYSLYLAVQGHFLPWLLLTHCRTKRALISSDHSTKYSRFTPISQSRELRYREVDIECFPLFSTRAFPGERNDLRSPRLLQKVLLPDWPISSPRTGQYGRKEGDTLALLQQHGQWMCLNRVYWQRGDFSGARC